MKKPETPIMAVDIVAPGNYKDPMRSDLHEQWAEAIHKELRGLIGFKVREVVPRAEMLGHRLSKSSQQVVPVPSD